jgi:hypothetical protein
MATFTLIIIVGLLSLVITPWIGNLNQNTFHHTDLMAGNE